MRYLIPSLRPYVMAYIFAVVLFIHAIPDAHAGDSLVGKVTAVKSFNLITLDYGSGSYEVRVVGIEAERDVVVTRQATKMLSDMILGKQVRLRFDGRAKNGEMLGRIWLGGEQPEQPVLDVGVELVRNGLVRSQKGYGEYKYGEMTRAEGEAKRLKRGLWKTVPQNQR